MALKEIQTDADKWIQQYKLGYFKPHEIMVRLMEETGELAREINHEFGPKKKKEGEKDNEIGDEIADIFFTLACMANSLNIDLDEKWAKMMDKLYKRDNNRWEKK
jgi:NTP pyrophosphatase (non-canonical NTP hydrolase)